MSGLDPRLADEALLRVAALRLKQRTAPASPSVFPPAAWWQELWGLVQESPYGLAMLVHVGIPEPEALRFLLEVDHGQS